MLVVALDVTNIDSARNAVNAAVDRFGRIDVLVNNAGNFIITITSTAGIVGQAFCTAYAASRFGLEGWIESLAPEVEPFGIRTMLEAGRRPGKTGAGTRPPRR